tara:strand:- start:820 stop:1035 length:216 start_codon:yes stop_codon:yes gene_type:complete
MAQIKVYESPIVDPKTGDIVDGWTYEVISTHPFPINLKGSALTQSKAQKMAEQAHRKYSEQVLKSMFEETA